MSLVDGLQVALSDTTLLWSVTLLQTPKTDLLCRGEIISDLSYVSTREIENYKYNVWYTGWK